jgi:hypothetical protein
MPSSVSGGHVAKPPSAVRDREDVALRRGCSRPEAPAPEVQPAATAQPHAVALQSGHDQVSLCEVLDRVLNKGVVVAGDIVISVADVDLIYLGLQVVLTSVETMNRCRAAAPVAGSSQAPTSAPSPVPSRHSVQEINP